MSNSILILGARYETGNMGVDALLSGTIASVLQRDKSGKVVLLEFSRNPRVFRVANNGSDIEVRLENIRFSWKIWLENNGFRLLLGACLLRAFPLSALRRWCIARHPALQTINDASIALSLAGGDSFSDIYGFRRLLYVCLPQYLVLAMNRPLVLLPQTLGPFRSRWARWMARLLVSRAAMVYARDQASLILAQEMLSSGVDNLAYSQDMAFALEASLPMNDLPDWITRRQRPLVGLNVSGLLFMGGYNRDNMFGLTGDYPELIRNLICWFMQKTDADLVMVPHVDGEWESDAKACKLLYDELAVGCCGRLHLADPRYDHREIKYLIGKCDFFIGARMHACIAALSQGIPAVGMAYSRKFAGVFESVEVPELVTDLRKLSSSEVLASIMDLYLRRDIIANKLRVPVARAKIAAQGLYGRVVDDVFGCIASRLPGNYCPTPGCRS